MEFKVNTTKRRAINFDSLLVFSKENSLYNDFIKIKNNIKYVGYSEMGEFAKNNITMLLSLAINKKSQALQIITDQDFLIALDIIDISISKEYVCKFNCIYRSYVINPKKNVLYNSNIALYLYRIAFKLNKKFIKMLMDIGISESDSLWLIVNRYSSTDERRNIRRMVRVMQHMNPSIMTEQMVIDIFSKTFSHEFTNLFIAVMTDKFDSFDNENEKYVYSTVSNALLDILNTMDEDDIKDILIDYENELINTESTGRFSLHTINSGDYNIICKIIYELEARGNKIK